MPGERLSMRKIRELLRLRFGQGLSQRTVGSSLGLSIGAVNSYLTRARMAGLGWPLPEGLSDEQLEERLYPPPPPVETERRPMPDWAMVHRELRRPNMTLSLLWEEYRTGLGAESGFSYSCYVAARVMLSRDAFPLARGRVATRLTQHKLRLCLADLTQFEVRHGSAVYFRKRRRSSGSRSTLC